MKEVDNELLKRCANNLMFDMKEEEYHTLKNEFDILLKQMDIFKDIEGLNDVTPMTFPFDCESDFLREDVASEPYSKEDILKNAKEVLDDQIVLPKVVL